METSDLLAKNLDFATLAETEIKNLRSSLEHFSDEFLNLEELIGLYKLFLKSFKTSLNREHIPILQMYFITFRSFLISSQLVSQGHLSEALTIISRASEAVGYAVVMFDNSEKIKVWLKKDETKNFKSLFGQPFPPGNKLLHPTIYHIYNITREYGSHANFVSTIHFSTFSSEKVEFVYCDFNDPSWMKRYLMFTIHSFFEFIVIFQELFKNDLNENWYKQYNSFLNVWSEYRDKNVNMFPSLNRHK